MENKSKTIKNIALTVIVIILLLLCILIVAMQKDIATLTQFGPTTDRQMMGYSIKTKNDKLVIIDGGNIGDTEQLKQYIKQNGSKVDAWFLTHIHTDHVGAFTQIINDQEIQIEKIYASICDKQWYEQYEPSRQEDIDSFFTAISDKKIEEPEIGDCIIIDNIEFKILKTKNTEITNNAINNSSMVIKVKTPKTSILFLGDTGVEASNKLLQGTMKEELKSDIVQVAHHGQAGATEELYKVINPKICLWPTIKWLWDNDIGTGENSGDWKTMETREWIEKLNVEKNYLAFEHQVVLDI